MSMFFLHSRTLLCVVSIWLGGVVCAVGQPSAGVRSAVFVFGFSPKSNMFNLAAFGNQEKLKALCDTVARYKQLLSSGQAVLEVVGYCAVYPAQTENVQAATTRAGNVASKLAECSGLPAELLRVGTAAKAYGKRKAAVVVAVRIPKAVAVSATVEPPVKEARADSLPAMQVTLAEPSTAAAPEPTLGASAAMPSVPVPPSGGHYGYHLALRSNMLYLLAATPNLGVEGRLPQGLALLVHAGWSQWSWGGSMHQRHHHIRYLNPELRKYLGQRQRYYVGVHCIAGNFHIKLNNTGREGTFAGGGLVAGYQLPLLPSLHLDLHLGLGNMRYHYQKYIHDHWLLDDNTSNYWGPTQAGATLVWRLWR